MGTRSSDASQSLFFDGVWHEATDRSIDVINPADEQVLTSISSASAAEVRNAVDSARRAQKSWALQGPIARGAILRQMADIVTAHRSELARQITQEMGKPLSQTEGEVDGAARFLRFSAEWDRRLEGEILPAEVPGEVINIVHEPIGVVVAICAWNAPLAILCRKIGPALVTGNTVVVKPSEISPLSTLLLFRLFAENMEIPPGVINLVTGGRTTGQALVDDEGVSMVSFTGHRDTGKSIMASASKRLTRIALELGGKAPAIVWKDADIDLAVSAITRARHRNSGQVCTSAERVFVHQDVLNDFTDRYVSAVGDLSMGLPMQDIDLGPLASDAQLAKATRALDTAVNEGAKVLIGGRPPAGESFSRGYWFAPTVLVDVHTGMDVMIEETFSPITPIIGISSLDDFVDAANDSNYGLSAYVFSRSYQTVMQAVRELQFGEIYVNRSLGESAHAHHSGYRESGIGGEDGKWGLQRYTQAKTVYHHFG